MMMMDRSLDHDHDDDEVASVSSGGGGGSNFSDDQSHTCTNHDATGGKTDSKDSEKAIGHNETKLVGGMRWMMFTVLAFCMLGTALGVYYFTSSKETQAFENDFESDSNGVLEAIGESIDRTLGAVDAFVMTIVSYAHTSNSSWPFVTSPDFAARAEKIRAVSNAVVLIQAPFITHDNRAAWENYTAANGAWVNESVKMQAECSGYYGPNLFDFYTLDYVWGGWDTPVNETDICLPTWQSAPVIPCYAPHNWDYWSECDSAPGSALHTFKESHQVIISNACMLPDPANPEEVAKSEQHADWFKDFIKPGDSPSEPVSDIYYPILDATDEIIIKDPFASDLVGTIALSIHWRDMLKDILPPGSDGVAVVFENECNPSFTYQINGEQAVYLGRGDHHDPRYDELENSAWGHELSSLSNSSDCTGVPIMEDFCPFHCRVFPSQEMQDRYTSNQPIVLTIATALIFLFTSAIFLGCDAMAEHRQKKVLKTATKTSKVVNSLFPSQVRDRLFEEEEEKQKLQDMCIRNVSDFQRPILRIVGVSIPLRCMAMAPPARNE